MNKFENSAILYGLSRVGYGPNGCTPYPMCLKSCANYLGQDVSIDFLMVSTGAAFRLTWDTNSWNGGNVDVIHTFENPEDVYRFGIESLGREFDIITRTNTPCDVSFTSNNNSDDKNSFIDFIKRQIDKGSPCIALGIIGPPEACIITGYREDGNILLGWNFFQNFAEFSTDVKIDESGYFISEKWWENNDTIAVISLGDIIKPLLPTKIILENAINILSGRIDTKSNKSFAKGIFAYDAWKKALLTESYFPQNAILPILAERLMCQGDAMDCLIDGRKNAALFMKKLSDELPEYNDLCKSAEEQFSSVVSSVCKMVDILGGFERDELQMRNLAKLEVRQKIALLIDDCKAADSKALEVLVQLKDKV